MVLVAMSAQMLMEQVMSKWNYQINLKAITSFFFTVVKPSTAPKEMKSFINQLVWLAERNGWECKKDQFKEFKHFMFYPFKQHSCFQS